MEKTSVYLDREERQRLQRLARLEHVSQAEIIRRAIREYRAVDPGRDFASARTFDGPGDSVADIAELELLAGFGG